MIAIGISDQQGHSAACRRIRGASQGRGGVIGIVWCRDGDHRRHQVEGIIFTRDRIACHTGIRLVGGIKSRRRYGGIAGTIYGDEAAIATGTGHTTYVATACGRSTAGCSRFKRLGRVGPAQNGLLQSRYLIRSASGHILVLGQQRRLRRFILSLLLVGRAQGESLVAAVETGALRSDKHRIPGQDIAFGKLLLAAICGDQVNVAFQLGNNDVLFQCDFMAAHVLS